MNLTPHIVSTRKLTSDRLDELLAKGWKFIDHDFITKVIHIPADLQEQYIHKHIVLTSIMGVKAFLEICKRLQLDASRFQVYCLSHGTKEYASASGLNIYSSASNAALLADEILKNAEAKEVTHISSNFRRDELCDKLIKATVAVRNIIAYHTEFTPVHIGSSYDSIIFFSPSAVESFLSLNPLRQVPCFCIGKTTAGYAEQKGYQHTYIAQAPSEDQLLHVILNYYSIPTVHVKE